MEHDYRKAKEGKMKATGPFRWLELAKARLRISYENTDMIRAMFLAVMALAFCTSMIAITSSSLSRDTGSRTIECMESCKSLGGIMVDRNGHGCFCHTAGKRILIRD